MINLNQAKYEINSLLKISQVEEDFSKSIETDNFINLYEDLSCKVENQTNGQATDECQLPAIPENQVDSMIDNSSLLNGKVQTKLLGFFTKPKNGTNEFDHLPNETGDLPKISTASKDTFKERIRPFYVKPNTSVANLNVIRDERKIQTDSNRIDELMSQTTVTPQEILLKLKATMIHKAKSENNSIVNKINNTPEIIEISTSDTLFTDDSSKLEKSGESEVKRVFKLFHFSDSRKPAFYGTLSKKPLRINGRRPFIKESDSEIINYDFDSDEEWELIDEEGEELKSEDEEEDEEDFDDEVENEWIVNVSNDKDLNSSSSESSDLEDADFDENNPTHIKADISADSDSGESTSELEDIDPEIEVPKMDGVDLEEKTFIRAKRKIQPLNNQSVEPNKLDTAISKNQRRPIVKLIPKIIGPVFSSGVSGVENDENEPGSNINLKSKESILSNFPVVYFPKAKPVAVIKPIEHKTSPEKIKKPFIKSKISNSNKMALSIIKRPMFNRRDMTKIAKIVHHSPLGLKILVEKIKQLYPTASKVQIQTIIQDNAIKERRNTSKISRWYVKESMLGAKKNVRRPPKVQIIDLNSSSPIPNKDIRTQDRPMELTDHTPESQVSKSDNKENTNIKEKSSQNVTKLLAFFQKL
ncbi:Chromatin assembly factor 1 subunit A [Smittium mucronatum]|uniref:Chromatin assembly factor 1 subunit A n=1 Tax=Smittium mucronatum TaxID=133383 RepID=A0A1R0GX80_9FUNG|nr:Chromatin assembly factor 1 subunit A [Smittium mucronatum]OLY82895.1 Chromatin assembly factor 1 subunit A [Smittium mucronatum]